MVLSIMSRGRRRACRTPAPRRRRGRSAQAGRINAPERKTHKHPFTNNRLSDPVRPGALTLPGDSGAILAHCTSFNSYRLIPHGMLRVATRCLMHQTSNDLGILNVDPP